MLGNGPGDADHIRFLEGIVADQGRRHLPGDDDHRDGIHVGGGDAGDGVGGARAAGGNSHPDLAAGPGVAVGSMDRGLLMTGQDVLDRRIHQVIVDVDDRPAGITKDGVHPFQAQAFE